jgi:hypothetical protein
MIVFLASSDIASTQEPSSSTCAAGGVGVAYRSGREPKIKIPAGCPKKDGNCERQGRAVTRVQQLLLFLSDQANPAFDVNSSPISIWRK